MKVKIPQNVESREVEVDVVEALRQRAAYHVQKELSRAPRRESTDEEYEYRTDSRPVDLWTAKLCLEIADLFIKTERRIDR